jgi:uncharacterized OB-fold protein
MKGLDEWRTLPTPDRLSAPYWLGLAEGRFLLLRCNSCGYWIWPARPICSHCQSGELAWTESPGTGEVYSWVVTHQAYAPDLAKLTPYPVALVRLDEQDDLLVPGRYIGLAGLAQGLRVQAQFERINEEIGLLLWSDG